MSGVPRAFLLMGTGRGAGTEPSSKFPEGPGDLELTVRPPANSVIWGALKEKPQVFGAGVMEHQLMLAQRSWQSLVVHTCSSEADKRGFKSKVCNFLVS